LYSHMHTYHTPRVLSYNTCSLEGLFYKYGVDVILEAHEHSYERLWPVYNEHVTADNYIDPKAPVHLISGTAGCNEFLGECIDPMLGPRGMYNYTIIARH